MTIVKQAFRAVPAAALVLSLSSLGGCAAVRGGGGAKEGVEPVGSSKGENRDPKTTGLVNWPKPTGEKPVDRTIKVKDFLDGGMVRFYGVDELGTNDQDEHQGALFDLDDGATLANVILGDPSADGVHCRGVCTLNNVWWERVGEDAATFRGMSDTQTSIVNGGGASGARDKVFQHNGGGTVVIKNFYVEWFGKLYRSCGNCKGQVRRGVVFENITAVVGPKSKTLAGVNVNYGDTAEFRGVNKVIDSFGRMKGVCLRYQGNSMGMEPKEIAFGADGTHCKYTDQTVVVQRPGGGGGPRVGQNPPAPPPAAPPPATSAAPPPAAAAPAVPPMATSP